MSFAAHRSSSKSAMALKLLIDSRSKKVLFAEAGKDFVDFIFSLLALPLGTVIKLISAKSMVGSVGRLYESVEKLSETYLQPNQNKSSLLQLKIASSSSNINVGASAPLILAGVGAEPPAKPSDFKYYTCSGDHFNSCKRCVTTTEGLKCSNCKMSMNKPLTYVSEQPANPSAPYSVKSCSNYDEKESGGFVRGVVTYMVMDDLEVIPMSAISSITLINKFSIRNGGSVLEEKTVYVGMQEGLALLQRAFKSTTVLTDIFS